MDVESYRKGFLDGTAAGYSAEGRGADVGGFMRAADEDFILSHAVQYFERLADEIEPLPSAGGVKLEEIP